jgi:uncharacterized membrane protein YhaH (DUF805 family)
VGFGQAISHNLSNITNFSGRASRPEFWWWVLAVWLIDVVISLLWGPLTGEDSGFLWLLGYAVMIVVMLATIAVGCRRLHDTGRSGWLQLLWLVPCVGVIVLIVFWVQPTTPGDNVYGPPPTA